MGPSRRRRIMMVVAQYPPVYGGAGQQAELLAQHLVQFGWQPHIVTLDHHGVGSGVHGGVEVTRICRGRVPTTPLTRMMLSLLLGLTAASQVMWERPRVVHLHGSYWWGIPAAVTGRLLGCKVIVKVTRDGEDDPETVFRKRLGPIGLGWIYGSNFKLADHIVLLSAESYRKTIAYSNLAPRAVRLNNGVDRRMFDRGKVRALGASLRARESISPNVKIVLFVGYLARHKGVLDIVDAWAAIRKRHPSTQLWLVGPTEGFYRELDPVTRNSLHDSAKAGLIKVFGPKDHEELPAFYGAADVYVLPSYAEGMPNSLAEAIMCGCCIVASDIPGIRDLVDSTAFVHPPGDVAALAQALENALASSRQPSKEATKKFDMECVSRAYDQLYRL